MRPSRVLSSRQMPAIARAKQQSRDQAHRLAVLAAKAETERLRANAYGAFLDRADAYVEQKGLPLPVERHARARLADPSCVLQPTRQLDHRATGVSAVIWATGYTFDFSWIDLPVLNGRGEPKHDRGIAPIPGLYFLGLPWLSKMNSSFLNGVGDDAARLAEHIRCRAAALSSMV